jgi:hypothetical protein
MALPADQRRALEILAGSSHGVTESVMLPHGFTVGTLNDLVRNGFASDGNRGIVRSTGRISHFGEASQGSLHRQFNIILIGEVT